MKTIPALKPSRLTHQPPFVCQAYTIQMPEQWEKTKNNTKTTLMWRTDQISYSHNNIGAHLCHSFLPSAPIHCAYANTHTHASEKNGTKRNLAYFPIILHIYVKFCDSTRHWASVTVQIIRFRGRREWFFRDINS